MPAAEASLTSEGAVARKGSRRHPVLADQRRTGLLFVTPALVLFVVFSVVPVVYAFYLAFTDYRVLTPPRWIGLENFVAMAHDPVFWVAMRNTTYYAIGYVPGAMVLGLIAAVLLNGRIRGVTAYRTAFYIPVVTSIIVASIIWLWIYNPQVGLLNWALSLIGVQGPAWLYSTTWAMPAVIIMSVWKNLGYVMIIYLAALQGIPAHLYEAASVDGASGKDSFFKITLPLLKPATFFIFVISCISSFQVFGAVYVMTKGGPVNSTTTLVYEI
ncbi:MAG TPA: sugar ABC transporter permease, partial [Chloroflexota bacterium]|nr:sugar ABC transporter permease [Chloroflexota bacterium]